MKPNILNAVCLSVLLLGCRHVPSPHVSHARDSAETHLPATVDERLPLPLLPRMARHQLENMRDHLAAMQEILTALSTNDFAAIEHAASRIGYSEQMRQMCTHMGAGAPGFTELALNFHHTADTISAAAKARDISATLKAVSATLKTCVDCHSIYRQQIVDEAAWKKILGREIATRP